MINAYLVLGAESTGTRLMTEILIGAGCLGDATHEQSFDKTLPYAERPIVWRRSIPHNGEWVTIPPLIELLRGHGYSPRMVIMSRDWHITAKSQVKAGHVTSEHEALIQIARAYKHIFNAVGDVPYTIVNYEALVLHADVTIAGVYDVLGAPVSVTIRDENRKWLT